MSESLFHKYGGFSRIAGIVHEFYRKVNLDDEFTHYFEGINMERLIRHQTDFLCLVFGGPVPYSGRDLELVHRKLGITYEHFVLITDLLEETLEEDGIEDEDIAEIMGTMRSYEDVIVTVRPEPTPNAELE
jgi:hemoglobin